VATIVRNLPFFSRPTKVTVQGREVSVKADQIIVSVSLAAGGAAGLEPRTPRFPAILDTGHTHNFSIHEQQLIDWAGVDPRVLNKIGEIRVGNDRLPLLDADIWLYRNVPGKTEIAAERVPFCVELDAGVAVYPRSMDKAPRLPLIGLRAMRMARFRVNIDCDALRCTIRTGTRFRVLRFWLERTVAFDTR
jgi:hypothetical protein